MIHRCVCRDVCIEAVGVGGFGRVRSLLLIEADDQERAVRLTLRFTPALLAPPPRGVTHLSMQSLAALGLPQPARTEAVSRRWICLGWPGVHWLILNGRKCVWLTFVLLMFRSVVFFLTMATSTSWQKHLLFLSEPSPLSCPVGYFGRQGLFFSSGSVAISYQIPPPVFPVLRFSLCEHSHSKKRKNT